MPEPSGCRAKELNNYNIYLVTSLYDLELTIKNSYCNAIRFTTALLISVVLKKGYSLI